MSTYSEKMKIPLDITTLYRKEGFLFQKTQTKFPLKRFFSQKKIK